MKSADNRKELIDLLDEAIAAPPGKLLVAERQGTGMPQDVNETLVWPRLNITFASGLGKLGFFLNGRWQQLEIGDGTFQFIPSFAPLAVHRRSSRGLAIVMRPNYIRIVYAESRSGIEVDKVLAFHIYDQMNEAIFYLFKTLDSLSLHTPGVTEEHYRQLLALMLRMARENLILSSAEIQTHAQWLWQHMVDFIEKNALKKLTREDVAKHFQVTPGYVSTLFQQCMKLSFCDYLNRFRLDNAVELLKLGRYRVEEVADMSGFSTSAYFIACFKKRFGVTPGDFMHLAAKSNRNWR